MVVSTSEVPRFTATGARKLATRFLIALVAAGSLTISASASAAENIAESNARSQSAVATGGWLAKGGLRFTDERGNLFKFRALLMYPDGEIEGRGPQRPGEPDLRRPWVALVQSFTDSFGNGHTECVSFANPSSAAYENTGEGQVPALYADVICDDFRNYDFYRVEWRGIEPMVFGPIRTVIARGPFQEYFYSSHVYDQPHYSGGVEWTTFRYDWGAQTAFRICGYRDGRAECLTPQGQTDPWGPGAIVGGWNAIRSQAGRLERTYCC
jgi:hypothetical protein